MPSIIVKEASAASAVGTDLMNSGAGLRFRATSTYRKIVRIGVVGSSAVGNAAVDVYYGATLVAGALQNTSSGAVTPLEAKDILPLHSDYWAEPGEPIIIAINTASATNVLVVYLEIAER